MCTIYWSPGTGTFHQNVCDLLVSFAGTVHPHMNDLLLSAREQFTNICQIYCFPCTGIIHCHSLRPPPRLVLFHLIALIFVLIVVRIVLLLVLFVLVLALLLLLFFFSKQCFVEIDMCMASLFYHISFVRHCVLWCVSFGSRGIQPDH